MATQTSRPGRTLIIFVLVIVGMFAAVAAHGVWKPKLGLDLQGGQRITLQAKASGGGGITPEKLDEAAGIISQRVDSAAVAENEVSTQGNDIIVVEIPGQCDEDLQRTIGTTAQLRFRMVAYTLPVAGQPTTTTPPDTTPPSSDPTATEPTDTATQPTATEPTRTGKPSQPTNSGKNRAVAPWLEALSQDGETTPPTDGPSSDAPTTTPTQAPSSDEPTTTSPAGTTPAAPADSCSSSAAAPTAPTTTGGPPVALVPPVLEDINGTEAKYKWVAQFVSTTSNPSPQPPAEWLARLSAYDCDKPDPSQPGQIDIPGQPLLACDDDGNRYLLGPSMVDGTDVTDASAAIPQGGVNYVVDVEFNGEGAKLFGDVTTRLASNLAPAPGEADVHGGQLGIVLDGKVLSAPGNEDAITGGRAEISGSSTDPFTQDSSTSLANSLKFGALPLSFTIVNSSQEGPELAANQLDAGIQAGIFGLLLVVLYCLLYYRGLSVVIVTSLLIAGVVTYASVLLLGNAYGFTMTLPGIAGFIVAVGITADSFIVYFERLRDEVRDGRTLRTSVETGWSRARTTIIAADSVSLLAAVVLFIFAIGVVKGFAFALGLSTVIDLFVVFFFTKPMVTMLSRTKFYGQGHKFSGLDRQHLGMPELKRTPRSAGGEA